MPEEDPRIIELRSMREKARQGGGADRIAKQHAKNKLTARERIEANVPPLLALEAMAVSLQLPS